METHFKSNGFLGRRRRRRRKNISCQINTCTVNHRPKANQFYLRATKFYEVHQSLIVANIFLVRKQTLHVVDQL
jgi:hypothetical protein